MRGTSCVSGVKFLLSEDKWLIRQDNYLPNLNQRYETIFTLANGYMGIRGTFEEGAENEHPGNFIAGVFNKSDAQVRELVNVQNWLGVKVYIADKPVGLNVCEVIEFKRILDMRKGLLYRKNILRDFEGRLTMVEAYRFVSRHDLHRSGIKLRVTPLNYNGKLSFESIIDGSVINSKGSPGLKVKHIYSIENSDMNKKGCYLETATRDDGLHIGVGTAIKAFIGERKNNVIHYKKFSALGELSVEYFEIAAAENKTVEIEKYVATYTTRDVKKGQLRSSVEKNIEDFLCEGMEKEFGLHVRAWEKAWSLSDICIDGDGDADRALRFNIFHLLSCANENDPGVSIAARGLHGEGYKGHVFWDTEIFMLPFFTYTYPEAAKTLLMYRYNTLEAAKENARLNGYKGAQYPWESADTGKEETPRQGIDYLGNPVEILTGKIEYHITADIAFAVYEYFRATGDVEFMIDYGSEIMIETARFWVSRLEYNEKLDRYEINCVIGPDEFHEHVNNNFYTNYFAKWNIRKSLDLIYWIKEEYPEGFEKAITKSRLTDAEICRWNGVADKIYIPFDEKKKLIEQFEGYFKRTDYVIERYNGDGMPVWPEGVDITRLNDTQLIKQADVVMLLLLLGDEFEQEVKKANFEYYEKRTMHKSSLSPSIYSIMGLKVGDASKAYQYFIRTANTDLSDNQGNTYQGLHMASAGGTWQVAVYGFAGMHVDKGGALCFTPWLPKKWKKLSFKLFWKGNLLKIDISGENVDIELLEGRSERLEVKINGHIRLVEKIR